MPKGTCRSSKSTDGGVNKEAGELGCLVFQLMQ